MRRALLCCVGFVLGLAAEAILWNAHDLYLFADSWHSAAFTRLVGVGVIVEGAFLAFGAALCLGRALRPWAPVPGVAAVAVGGAPVLPVCGVFFLLAAVGPFEQARFDAEILEVTDSMPGQWGPDIVEADRRRLRTDRAFGVLWLAVGGLLLATPLFLEPRVWQLAWRTNGVGWAVAACGFLLSGLGACVCLVNGMMMEAASAELSLVGHLGVLAGAAAAVVGSTVAVRGKATP